MHRTNLTGSAPFLQQLTRLLVLCCLFFSQAGSATEADEAEKIHVNADRMKLNIETGNSIYSGNVKITQGDLVLTGDTVTIEQHDKLVERINVTGKPATYTHVMAGSEPIHATSRRMVYTSSEHRLVLIGDARLSQPDHTVTSQKIVYDTLRRTVVAGNEDRDTPVPADERVNITLTPKKKDVKKKNAGDDTSPAPETVQ